MSRRIAYLDGGVGERRGVVTLDERPEHLIIERDGAAQSQRLGARVRVRVSRVNRPLGLAFVEMPDGADAVARAPKDVKLVEGASLEGRVTAEPRSGKGALVRIEGPGQGGPALLEPAPDLESRLKALTSGEIVRGAAARDVADEAQAEVLETVHALPGGGSIAIEPTRALVAIDVDVGERDGADAARNRRQVNLVAISEAARLLRLKSLAGTIVMDLAGQGHDGQAISVRAKAAFQPDQPGVTIGRISRLGLMELSVPWRRAPVMDLLQDTLPTETFRLLRAIEREGESSRGARLEARCSAALAASLQPWVPKLAERLGDRIAVIGEDGSTHDRWEVRCL